MYEAVNTKKMFSLKIQYILYAFPAKCLDPVETHKHIKFTPQNYFVPVIHIFPFPFFLFCAYLPLTYCICNLFLYV